MKRIEYKFAEKKDWPRGEWDQEPDKVQWTDEATGLPCLAVRSNPEMMGNWCGYVGVSEGHPFFAKDFEQIDAGLAVHGGLTFSNFCAPEDKEHGICHVPGPGEPDRIWWLGFDCGHAFDYQPAMAARFEMLGGVPSKYWHLPEAKYRNLAYVQAECVSLAEQLAAVEKGIIGE